VRQRTGLVIAVTLTGSPSEAIARTPTHRFVPRSQIKHSYGFAISSACDNLYCRYDLIPIFITIVMRNARATLMRAASRLVSTLGVVLKPIRERRHECRRGTQECVRHNGFNTLPRCREKLSDIGRFRLPIHMLCQLAIGGRQAKAPNVT